MIEWTATDPMTPMEEVEDVVITRVVMNNIKTEGFFCPSQAISSGQPCVLQNYILCRAPHQLLEDTLIGQCSAVRKLLTNQRLVFRQAAGSLYILFESISSWTEVWAEDDTCEQSKQGNGDSEIKT